MTGSRMGKRKAKIKKDPSVCNINFALGGDLELKATWKDSDIKKNPKYAAAMGSDESSFDISALRKRKPGGGAKPAPVSTPG